MARKTEIYSIFGQIDAVVAAAMVAEGKATKIEQDVKAQFAIVLPRAHLAEYERRVHQLYL